MRDTVLLLTHTADELVPERVASALERRGARPVRVDTDLFPTALGLTAPSGWDADRHALVIDGERLELERVRAVWWRKHWSPRLPEHLEPDERAACTRESMAAFTAFADAFHGLRQVNDPSAMMLAENKQRQLREARAAGLRVPPTLVTNQPDDVRRFYDAHGGDIVTKMLTPYSYGMTGGDFVYTSRIRAEDLDDLDGLSLCPMVFQARVEKERELRVMVVGDLCFAGAVDVRGVAGAETDWRRCPPGASPWLPADVPEAVRAGLAATTRALGLVTGAADVMVTPEGDHVFLEVNPSGEWGMLELFLDLPISDAIAEALLAPAPSQSQGASR